VVVNINGVNLFQVLPRTEVIQLLARIGNSVFSTQVTLFANAIASSGWKLGRIDDGARQGSPQVSLCRAVAALAGDSLRLERRVLVDVIGSRNWPCFAGVTKQALGRYGSIKIGSLRVFVSWGHAPTAPGKVAERRLKKMAADLDKVSEGMRS